MAEIWFYAKDDQRVGPFDRTTFETLISRGILLPDTKISAGESGPWIVLGESELASFLPESKPAEAISIASITAALEENPFLSQGKEIALSSANLLKIFARRIVRSDLRLEKATTEERRLLEAQSTPIKSALAQDYAAWRRAVLWVAFVCAALAWGLNQLQSIQILSGDLPIGFKLWYLSFSAVQFLALLLLFGSAFRWFALKPSRDMARVGWLLQFFGPWLLALIPVPNFFIGYNQMDRATAIVIGGAWALRLSVLLGAKMFGVFPGVLRGALTVKTLLPQSTAVGWVVGAVAPICIMLFLVPAVISFQVLETMLGIGFLCMAASGAVLAVLSTRLALPRTEAEASQLVQFARRIQQVLVTIAMVLFVWWSLAHFSKDINLVDLASILLAYAGNVLWLAVVISDFLVTMIDKAHLQGRDFHGSANRHELEQRLEALSEVTD